MYKAAMDGGLVSIAILAVLFVGNGLLAAAGLAVTLKPFMGAYCPAQGPARGAVRHAGRAGVFGILAVAAGFANAWFADTVLAPAASAIANRPVEGHMELASMCSASCSGSRC
jgi:multicomponent Na+:H+ antiporter subunit A